MLLVVPRRARGLHDAMAWPRIAGYARQRGLTVHVLASRRDVRDHALNAGLSTARTPRGLRPAPTLRVPLGPRELALRLPSLTPLLRLAAFAAIPLLVFGAAAYYVPSADIFIAPPGEPLSRAQRACTSTPSRRPTSPRASWPRPRRARPSSWWSSTISTGTTTVGDVRGDDRAGVHEHRHRGHPVAGRHGPGRRRTNSPSPPTSRSRFPAGETAYIGATAIRPGTTGNLGGRRAAVPDRLPADALTAANPVAAEGR